MSVPAIARVEREPVPFSPAHPRGAETPRYP
jgi:hypothetical protein